MTDAFADLEKLAAPDETPPEETPKPSLEKSPEELEPAEPEPKPERKVPDVPAKGSRVKSLREAYESAKLKMTEMEAELKALKNAKPPEDPEKKTLSERLAEREKRLQEVEERLRFSAYEQSDEYREKYEKPFVDSYQYGRAKTASLKVAQEDGTVRQATPEDFDRIMQVADDDAAADLASEMFGNKDKLVLLWRDQVLQKNAVRTQALEEYKKSGAERHRQQSEAASRHREQMGKLWTQYNDEAREKYPQWFKPQDGDDEGNKLLEEGYKLADSAFSGTNGMGPEQTVRLHSAIRNRAAAFGRLVHQNKALARKISDLEKELKAFKGSEPGAGAGTKTPGQARKFATLMEESEAGLEELAR